MATYGQRLALWRHLPAITFDLATIAWPTTVAMAAFHERFTVLPTTDGSPRFSPVEQARINEIDQIFNRGIRVGDSIFTLSGSGWWLTMLVLVIATVTVFIAVPAVLGQRTIGQLLVGMAPLRNSDSAASRVAGEPDIDLSEGAADPVELEPADLQLPDPNSQDLVPLHLEPEEIEPLDIEHSAPDSDDDTNDDIELAGPDIDMTDGTTTEPTTSDIDITDAARWLEMTLADEAEYRRWDRDFGTSAAQPAAQPAAGTTMVQPAQLDASSVERPEWSDDWNAWMYWDATTRRWYRHDTDNARWTPVS